jgi:elongation factor 1-alpha
MEKLTAEAKAQNKPSFAFAYFMDTHAEERKRGVTINCNTKEFFTEKYHYTIIDAPGHRDFIKNMISGASQADVALLLVPAERGGFEKAIANEDREAKTVKGQTRHHAELTNLLGIRQIIVGVNKMDTASYGEERFREIEENMRAMLKKSQWKDAYFVPIIPISGFHGDNITKKSDKMPWYKGFEYTYGAKSKKGVCVGKKSMGTVKGHTLFDALNDYVLPPLRTEGRPFRMPVSGVYNIQGVGTVITGRVEQGTLVPNTIVKNLPKPTPVTFWPSNIQGLVNTIEMHHKNLEQANTGDNVGIAVKGLSKDNMPKVGDVMALSSDDTIGAVKTFTAEVKVQDWISDKTKLSASGLDETEKEGKKVKGKKGYTPLVLVRTAKAPCQMTTIHWKLSPAQLKTVKKKKDLVTLKENSIAEGPHKFVQRKDFTSVEFMPTMPFTLEAFQNCEGLGRVAVLESNNLVMLGKVTAVTYKKNE